MLNEPVSGFRTWMWTMAAPAFAASMAVLAICSGVIAQWGLLVTLVSSPVTAQVMMTSEFMETTLAKRRAAFKYYGANNITSRPYAASKGRAWREARGTRRVGRVASGARRVSRRRARNGTAR